MSSTRPSGPDNDSPESTEPKEETRTLEPPEKKEPPNPILSAAGALSALWLFYAAATSIPISESLSHLLTSIIVVTIVHLLDHYSFQKATRREMTQLRASLENSISTKMRTALQRLTAEVSHTVAAKSDETRRELIENNESQSRAQGEAIIEHVSQGTVAALETLGNAVTTTVGEMTSKLLDDTKSALNDILHQQSASLQAMELSGMTAIYASRASAAKAIAAALRVPTNSRVRLLGISLNDFFRGDQQELNAAWTELRALIDGTEEIANPAQSLHVQVLMIDPNSRGARLRSFIESQADSMIVGRLSRDVVMAAEALQKLEKLANQRQSVTRVRFEARVYNLSPTMFLCHVDHTCFIQQYHYWTRRLSGTPIPVLEYSAEAAGKNAYPMHHELAEHFDMIWEHASNSITDFLSSAAIGTDEAIGACRILNIYKDRDVAAKRISQVLENAQEKVWIQGISLKAFFSTGLLARKMFNLIASGKVQVKVLILDPTSEQAAYRSYRERLLQPQSRGLDFDSFRTKFQEHSQLTTHTLASIESLRTWVADLQRSNPNWKCNIQARMYKSAPVCFMLAGDDRVLVEPYNYGKVASPMEGASAPITLGTDMSLMEFGDRPDLLYADDYDALRFPYSLQIDHYEYVFSQAQPIELFQSGRENAATV